MTRPNADLLYTFVAVREDGIAPAVELRPCSADSDAFLFARAWLAEHSSCTKAQVWRDTLLVGEVEPAVA